MSLLITLFGGMLVAALLYGLGRWLRLSNFWAAVLACGPVSFLYLAYAVVRWPGLDVVTLHLVAYPTVAVLLYQLYGEKARHAESMHWAPKLMVGFFVVITLLYGGFVYIAGQGLPPALAQLLLPGAEGKNVHTGFAGVVEHRDEAAKGIAHHLKMEDRLSKLGWRVDVTGLGGLRAGQSQPVAVQVLDRSGQAVPGVHVRLRLGRPGQRPAQDVRLAGGGESGYEAVLSGLDQGTWVAILTLQGAGTPPITLEHTLEVR